MKVKHKVVTLPSLDNIETLINPYLGEGWIVKSCVAQHVSVSSGSHFTNTAVGGFVFILEKTFE